MTAKAYRDLLLRQWPVLLICVLMAGLGAFGSSLILPPVYQGTATLEVVIPSRNYPAAIAADRYIQSEIQLATSDDILHVAAAQYGLNPTSLTRKVTAVSVPNSLLIKITAQDGSASRAAGLANAIADALVDQQVAAIQHDNTVSQADLQTQIASTKNQLDSTNTQIQQLQAAHDTSGKVESLKAQASELQQHLQDLNASLQQLQVTEASGNSYLQVASRAQPQSAPLRPNSLLYTGAGLAFGLLLGLLIILLRGYADQRVRTSAAVGALLGCPILAEIAVYDDVGLIDKPAEEIGRRMEPYRQIEKGIAFQGVDEPIRALAILSPGQGEGADVIASDLALVAASEGKQVLLVDADFARPTQHERFGVQQSIGLSSAVVALANAATGRAPRLEDLLQAATRVRIPSLRVVPSGPIPPDASKFIASKAMRTAMSMLRTSGATLMIVSGPPLLDTDGAGSFCSQVGGVLLVIDLAHARRQKLLRVRSQLDQSGANIVGCVVLIRESGAGKSMHHKPNSENATPPSGQRVVARAGGGSRAGASVR